MIILLCKIIMMWFQNRGTALTILQEMEGVAGDIRRGRRGQEDDRNMEPFLRRGQCGDRRSRSPMVQDPADLPRSRAGSLEPFNRQEGLGFQRQGSLPPQGMDRQRDRSRSVTPLDRQSRASSVASELSDVVEEEEEEYLPPPRRASPFLHSPVANRTRQRLVYIYI
jgi:hypothetical protein